MADAMTMCSETGLLSQMIERGLVAGSCRWSERARGPASPNGNRRRTELANRIVLRSARKRQRSAPYSAIGAAWPRGYSVAAVTLRDWPSVSGKRDIRPVGGRPARMSMKTAVVQICAFCSLTSRRRDPCQHSGGAPDMDPCHPNLAGVMVSPSNPDGTNWHCGRVASDAMKSLVDSLLNDLGIAASIVIIAGGVLGVHRGAATLYSRTIGSRRDLAGRLNQLAAGVTLRYVEERFGTPAFVRTFVRAAVPAVPAQRRPLVRELVQLLADPNAAAVKSPTAPGTTAGEAPAQRRPVRELLFREKHAWIQVLVDQNDAVVRFSITVTDPRLRFQIRELTHGQLAARLGHSRFSDVHTGWPPDGRSLRIGAHNHEYAEAYWAGYPGFYQRFVISSNEVGTGQFGYAIHRQGPSFCREGTLDSGEQLPIIQPFDPDADYAHRFRAETTINTLTVLGPAHEAADLAEPRGPDSGQVWVVVPVRQERRQIRRRIRRPNRQMLRENRCLERQSDLEEADQAPTVAG
jgi:hypothetical protein